MPDHLVAELVDGELFTSPRPAFKHARVTSRLGYFLGTFEDDGDGHRGWWILDEPELHFGKDVVVPDMAGWRVERMPTFPENAVYGTLAPDWLCEVLSPSTMTLDRTRKFRVYARVGVRHVWLIDPIEKTFEVLTLDARKKKWISHVADETDERVRAVPFEVIEIKLGYLWGARAAPPS